MPLRILVTGAAGFIGSRAVRHLAKSHHVVAVDRNPERLQALARAVPDAAATALDIADADEVTALWRAEKLDAALHLAWYADPRDYLTSHANLESLNASLRFVETILRAGCQKIVVGGSCAEYGAKRAPLVETDPAEPATLYGAAKLSALTLSRILVAEAGAELAWGRIFHLHGPGEDPRRLIPWVAAELAAGRPVDLTDGTQIRDHLHVDDVATGLGALLAPGARGVFNVCSGVPVSLRSVLETLGDLVGRRDLLRFGTRPHRPGEWMFLAGDAARLRGLGWAPRFELREGLADSLRGRHLS